MIHTQCDNFMWCLMSDNFVWWLCDSLSPLSASPLRFIQTCVIHHSTPLISVKDRALHIWASLWGVWTGERRLNDFIVAIFLSFLFLYLSIFSLYKSLSFFLSLSPFLLYLFPLLLHIYGRFRSCFIIQVPRSWWPTALQPVKCGGMPLKTSVMQAHPDDEYERFVIILDLRFLFI